MSIKKKWGVGAVGLVALGGSVFGVVLSSGIASASNGATTPQPVVTVSGESNGIDVTLPGDTSAQVDSGLNVQAGGQSGSQATTPDATEVASSEALSSETATVESDGVGGAQVVSGANVDSQSTGAQ